MLPSRYNGSVCMLAVNPSIERFSHHYDHNLTLSKIYIEKPNDAGGHALVAVQKTESAAQQQTMIAKLETDNASLKTDIKACRGLQHISSKDFCLLSAYICCRDIIVDGCLTVQYNYGPTQLIIDAPRRQSH